MRDRNAGTILIVDDEQPNLRVLARLMEQLGRAVKTASNGAEAPTSIAAEPLQRWRL